METEEKDIRWRVITGELRAAILDGRYPPGGALPSEPELVRRYGVSRPTVRKAIDTLVSEGLAYVMRGRGSFVRPTPQRSVILITNQERPDLAAPANHPDVRAYGWELGLRDSDTLARTQNPPFSDERIAADRSAATLLGLRPGHPVIHRRNRWRYDNGSRIEVNSWTKADLVPEWTDEKRYHQFRKRAKFFYQTLQRNHGDMKWITLTTARIAYEDERAPLGLDYAEALLIIQRSMVTVSGQLVEVTEVKAPANRFEIAHAAEIADDVNALFAPEELVEEDILLVV
jgi:DNA-binding GntR family transcriptional regulator